MRWCLAATVCSLLAGCSLVKLPAAGAGAGATPSSAAAAKASRDAHVYALVMNYDLQPVEENSSSCEELSDQAACAQAAEATLPAIQTTLDDLSLLQIPASMTTDNADLISALDQLRASCGPVVSASGRVAEAYADVTYTTADTQVSTVLTSIVSTANS